MAFFKFRQRGGAQPEQAPRTRGKPANAAIAQETVDTIRRRARHRLLGAVVLVLAAVIGFPMLFDAQPRPVAVNASIVIPEKNELAPLRVPDPISPQASLGDDEEIITAEAPLAPVSPAAAPPAPPVPAPKPAPTQDAKAKQEQEAKARREAEAKAKRDAEAKAKREADARAKREAEAKAKRDAEARAQREQQARRDADAKARQDQDARARREAEAKAKRDAEAKAKREAEAKARREAQQRDEASRARALLEGRGNSNAATKPDDAKAATRFVVQIGAYADAETVRQTRQKAERAGLKTYIQVVKTSAGERTRVRVGPFSSRQEADKALATLKKAGLGGSVQSL